MHFSARSLPRNREYRVILCDPDRFRTLVSERDPITTLFVYLILFVPASWLRGKFFFINQTGIYLERRVEYFFKFDERKEIPRKGEK